MSKKKLEYVLRVCEHNWSESVRSVNKENVHFDNEHEIHMSSTHFERNGCGQDLDLLFISFYLRVYYPTRCGAQIKVSI